MPSLKFQCFREVANPNDRSIAGIFSRFRSYTEGNFIRSPTRAALAIPTGREYRRTMAFGYREATEQELALSSLIVPAGDLSMDQRTFLNAFVRTRGVVAASKATKIHRLKHWDWCKHDADYQAAFEALRAIVEAEDAEGIKLRATSGWREPLHYKGRKTGDSIRRYSDSLSLGYMKAVDPRWRDGAQVNVGPARIQIEITQAANEPSSSESNEIIVKSSE